MFGIYSVPSPQCFLRPPVTNYMLLYSTLLCKRIARAPGVVKNISSLRWGGGDRIDPMFVYVCLCVVCSCLLKGFC